MKQVILRVSLVLMVCLGASAAISPTSAAGNHCSDRCAERYRYRKDTCKAIPYKHERQRCEESAKRAKDECKHRCG
jgi:hypothetical protein